MVIGIIKLFIISGELITQGYNFDVAHPPGYPLHMIIIYIATHIIPFGSIGWRANFITASINNIILVISVIGSYFLFKCFEIFSEYYKVRNFYVNILITGLYAFSPLVWHYSIDAEVFTLNNLFIILLIYLTLRITYEHNENLICIGALVCGLGLTNQVFI